MYNSSSPTIVFDVTEDDIAEGQRSNAYGCPVARAILRAVGKSSGVMVGWGYANIYWNYDPTAVKQPYESYTLNCKARIEMFDKRGYMAPFTGVATRDRK